MKNRCKRCLTVTLVFLCFFTHAYAQKDGDKIPGGELRKLPSNLLNEERTLIVSVPDGYNSSTTSYPVLYKLDAHQRTFTRAVSVLEKLQADGTIPELILVGVVNSAGNRDRDMHPTRVAGRSGSGGADNFLDFLEHELKPFIQSSYRTTGESTIVGFSTSAYFVVYSLVHQPSLFDHYLASSPMLGYGRELILPKMSQFLNSGESSNKSLFVIYGGKDHYEFALNTTPDLDKLVRSNMPESFRYECVFLKDEGHVPNSSLERGIEWTYSADGNAGR